MMKRNNTNNFAVNIVSADGLHADITQLYQWL